MDIVYGIMLDNGSGYNARCDSSLGLHIGDYCVIRKDFYLDYGQIVKQFDAPPPESTPAAPVEEERESGGTVFSAKKNEIYAIQRKAQEYEPKFDCSQRAIISSSFTMLPIRPLWLILGSEV